MGLLDLFVVALMPILETLLVTALGLLMAIDRINLLGSTARHNLNNIIFYVFSPALVVGYLAKTVTWESLVSMWFMPINILLTFIIGSALALILNKIARTPPHLQGLVIGCCSGGNLGNLLLIIIPAVCEEANSPFGDSSTCTTNGDAYASLSMAVGAIYLWSYVYIIMRVYANKGVKESSAISISSSGEASESCSAPLLTSRYCPSSEQYSDPVELPCSTSGGKVKVPVMEKIIQCINLAAEKMNLKMLFAPCTIAAIFGFAIGIVTPIRNAIIGDSAPLRVLESSATLLGDAAIPSMTLIVGANLLKGLKRSEVGVVVVVGIIVVRNVVLPVLGIGVVKAAYHFGLVGSDSLYRFILLLQYALPPGVTVGTIAQLFEAGESECSVIMLWSYAVASLFLTLWSTFFMWLVA